MERDEFLAKLQKARKAVEEYERENLNKPTSPFEHLVGYTMQKALNHPPFEPKAIGLGNAVCPYCRGRGKV